MPVQTDPTQVQLDEDQIKQIKQEAQEMTASTSKLTKLYQRYKEIYFMTARDTPKGNNIDKDDWKVTISPSGRNRAVGMKRLLDTSEVQITVKSKGEKVGNNDKIERFLKCVLQYSGMNRIARVEKDLNLSAVLFGPTVLACESVDDLIAVQKRDIYKQRLEKVKAYTPFLLKPVNPEQSFMKWGEFGNIAHLRKYSLTGTQAEERWGVTGLARATRYNIMHWTDLENTLTWIDGTRHTIKAKPHGMPSLNVASRLAGGTSLFDEPELQHQSFLYAHVKGEWDRRENLYYTYLFTALFMQGLPGPLLIVDPESVNPQEPIDIDMTGGVRKIFAKAQVADYPVVDSDVMQIHQILEKVSNESTIYEQTLGQHISGSTFSALAMMSSAGQLPLEDPKEAIAYTYRDIFEHMLDRVRSGEVQTHLLAPNDIPEQYEIEVTLQAKLPQDQLRNAQTAQGLGDLVSDEWKYTNLLQVSDAKAMRKQVTKEQLLKGLIGAMMRDQSLVMEMINTAIGRKQPTPGGPPPTDQAMPTGSDEMVDPSQLAPPDQAMLEQEGMMPGQPNAEQMPMTGPMPMPGEPGGPMPR